MAQDASAHLAPATRRALLVGTDTFHDAGLAQLRSPASDVAALARVLGDPAIGAFDVRTAVNASSTQLGRQMEDFFTDGSADDLLLLYVSTHGLVDESGQLSFAATNTRRDRMPFTSLAASFINQLMDASRSRRIVLILDTCYSGAFAHGMRAKASIGLNLMDRFEGRGRVILTSSGATQYAFEGDKLTEVGDSSSVFTGAIVRGLETGDADRDQDGYITVDELYDYAYAACRELVPHQTPMRWSSDTQGSIIIARSTKANTPTPDVAPGAVEHDLAGAQRAEQPLELPEQQRFSIRARAVSDLPAAIDRLGFRPLVDGLQKLLDDPATSLPLAIAIIAPWGAGKSSTMLQLKNRLQDTERGDTARRWHVVDFPAWKYESSERLWAALAKAIYEQPQRQMSRLGRIGFKMRLERSRQTASMFTAKGLGPLLVAAAALAVAMLGDLGRTAAGHAIPVLGATALVLASTAATLGRYWGIVGDPFKRAIEQHARRYRYQQQLGFTAEVNEDIQSLTDALLRDEDRALAVFVDDLDRCDSKHIVEMVETINQIFNSAQDRRCLFILGMDSSVVAASIDVAYADTVRTLKERGNPLGDDFGGSFLAKIVQMTLSVAPPDDTAVRHYLASVTGNQAPEGQDAAIAEEQVRELEAAIEQHAPHNPVDAFAIGQNLIDPDADDQRRRSLDEAVRRAQARRFNADSHDVAKAEFEVLSCLERNPRQIKRFDNAFRLQLHVACSTPGTGLDFSLDELIALGKWVALRLRWPHLAKALDADPRLLEQLERHANATDPADGNGGEPEPGLKSALADPRVFAVLCEPNAARRMAALPLNSFLRVT